MTPVRYAFPLSLVSVIVTKYNRKLQQAIVTDKACFFGLINTGKACLAGVVINDDDFPITYKKKSVKTKL